ncbi:hypothetical protein Tco_1040886 [Tanacetum coccineum]|uniref:Uncharacterized protein n=1 Tax=Tanacetum coccineum TaxID=301880 RepID=A0ABQ5GEN8_9ASTR
MEVLAVVEEEGDTWMTPIFKYLRDGTLLVEMKKARAVTLQGSLARMPNSMDFDACMQANDLSWQRLEDWLLLANHARGRKNANKSMLRLSSSQTYSKESIAKANPNHISMAILQMGN